MLLDDFDLYPDEMLGDVARRLGFGRLFDEAVGARLGLSAASSVRRWTTRRDARRPRRGARRRWSTGDVPIGAVVLDPDGEVIGRGRNVREATADPTGHAEVVALRAAAAAPRASGGSTAARSWSPSSPARCAPARSCWPGSTGWCSARTTTKAGAVGSLWDVVRDRRLNHRPEVVGGVLADEAGSAAGRVLRATDERSSASPRFLTASLR